MASHIIVVDKDSDYVPASANRSVLTSARYLHDLPGGNAKRPKGAAPVRVLNLCNDTSYLGMAYYVSLLAEARGHKVIPSVQTLLDLYYKRLYKPALTDVNKLLAKTYKTPPTSSVAFTFHVWFGAAVQPEFEELAKRLFDLFRCPLLAVELTWKGKSWTISTVKPISLKDIPDHERAPMIAALDRYTHAAWRNPKQSGPPKYTIGLLYNPAEKLPPSSEKTLKKFETIGAAMGVGVERITRKDFARVSEFDGIFIRETTAIDHHTFRFAKKAIAEGIPCIDDALSIMRCTNKVYLAELLQANNVPAPRTVIFDRSRVKAVSGEISYPAVLKIPDGAFSRGVHRVYNPDEFGTIARKLLDESDLILAQEFVKTEFDWRVGVLNNKPFFVSQYYMARNHWQIVKHDGDKEPQHGNARTMAVADAPSDVVEVAMKAANLIGNGLYGVDLKQTATGVYVMEVNDNPNLDCGIEDQVIGDEMYKLVIGEFIRRIEAR